MNNPKRTQATAWWKRIPLQEMDQAQWESLCDHCAKCCLVKLEDDDDGMVYYTDVACDLLDGETCQCSDYPNRETRMPDCLRLTPQNVDELFWMPPSCAYRLLHEGKNLPEWHHLLTGDKQSIHQTQQSIIHRFHYDKDINEEEWQEHVVEWPLLKKLPKLPKNSA